ncbi:MAG: hypothetical protein A3F84_22545 [Candidatus Handelsmanbacteria bacterium RIFCSPLOWO2_12_FULL_64_10]|uniref:Flagellar assembly protein T C-terminal domain-containing protein n=1 Tax=Handelsmanbacteria sp. (strain RIFCSPLOWO2_12_FULL_64_10) TaxID=1817868 RepID=A0A1F6D5B8_HANXR|nr:MAG: hypothetical protein A3F84_22545 [Candidatus Handelsmanbacteria bacterium RIFCSPLOWO2_12_FULL_64_10]
MRRWTLISIMLVALVPATAHAGPYKDASEALDRGDLRTAINKVFDSARTDDGSKGTADVVYELMERVVRQAISRFPTNPEYREMILSRVDALPSIPKGTIEKIPSLKQAIEAVRQAGGPAPPSAPQTPAAAPPSAAPAALPAVAPAALAVAPPMPPIQPETRKRIAIMPLTGVRNDYESRAIVESGLADVFVQLKRFEVVERSQIQAILQEKQFSQSGLVDESNAVSAGQVLGVDYLILGSISEVSSIKSGTDKYRAKVSAVLKVVSTANAAVIATVSGNEYSHGTFGGEAYLDLNTAVPRAAKKLVSIELKNKIWTLFPLEGYIIALSGSEGGMIDLGQEQGVNKGDKFSIVRQGASIRHPVTGAMLPGPIVELGVGEVSSVDPATSQVKLRLKQAVQVGDRIRMKEREKSFWDKVSD